MDCKGTSSLAIIINNINRETNVNQKVFHPLPKHKLKIKSRGVGYRTEPLLHILVL